MLMLHRSVLAIAGGIGLVLAYRALRESVIGLNVVPSQLVVKYPLWISLMEAAIASLLITFLFLVVLKLLQAKLTYGLYLAISLSIVVTYVVMIAQYYDFAWPTYPLSPIVTVVQLSSPFILITALLLIGTLFIEPMAGSRSPERDHNIHLGFVNPIHAEDYGALMREALSTQPKLFESDEHEVADVSTQTLAEMLGGTDGQNGFILGAFSDSGKLIGTIRVARKTGNKCSHIGDLFFAYTNSAHQGKGIDRQLLQAAIDGARNLSNLLQLYVNVSVTNDDKVDWTPATYTAAGFTATGTIPRSLRVAGEFVDQKLLWLPLRN